ncbi:MAG: universal stress protein [Promethearchaeota archaeon]|nr:MAG: universal stress protein [Candidatus Lokiarchaeota archaeon]
MKNEIKYEKILIPIDGSSKSIEAFEYALKFSSAYTDCQLHILYVIDEDNIEQVRSHGNESYGDLVNRYEQQGQNYLNKAFQSAKKINYNLSHIQKKIVKGNPVEEIVNYAKEFDLIIMAARGKKHIIEMMMGHVTERVLNLSNIPILIFP